MKFFFTSLSLTLVSLPLFSQTGIGTNSPSSTLHVLGDTTSPVKIGNSRNAILRVGNSLDNAILDFGVSKDNYTWIQSRDLSTYTLNYPMVLNPNGGGVGINTSSTSNNTLTVGGTIQSTGTIRSKAAGQILNTIILNETDLSINSNGVSISNGKATVATTNYTPVSNSSKILIQFHAKYDISGSASDNYKSYLKVGSTILQTQEWISNSNTGGGGRSSSLFPIRAVYTNSSTGSITISIEVDRISSDDTFKMYNDAVLTITEIAR